MTTTTPAVPSTPAAQWRADGQPDPHAGHYDGERAALTLGKLTDDELANGVFMNADQPMDIARVLARDPNYHPPIVWLTAAKERIRWLSRALERALATPAEQAELSTESVHNPVDSQLAAPQGWKLVPIDPTETMVVCGFESAPDEYFSSPEEWEAFEAMSGCQQAAHTARLCYAAMLDAAPAAPEPAPAQQAPKARGDHAIWLLEALIDIYDDGQNNAPEDRCYAEGAWSATLADIRAFVAGRPAQTRALTDEQRCALEWAIRQASSVPVMGILRALESIAAQPASGGDRD